MNAELLDKIVEAVLYEGYILYPYRASSKKNQLQRFTFGRVYPEAYHDDQNGAEPCAMQTQCLLEHDAGRRPSLTVHLRFLQPIQREVGELKSPLDKLPWKGEPDFRPVPKLEVNGRLYHTWKEAVERDVKVDLVGSRAVLPFSFPSLRSVEGIRDEEGKFAAVLLRRHDAVNGRLEVELEPVNDRVRRVTVKVTNLTPLSGADLDDGDAVLMRTFASTHAVLQVENGAFLSLTDPPDACRPAADECSNRGVWPVLVGDESAGERDTMLASPIILEDYPKIAAESAGSLYDGTEIDEILSLRILTMTEEEKKEMSDLDEHGRRILERTESLGLEQFLQMHGKVREMRPSTDGDPFEAEIFGPGNAKRETVVVRGVLLRLGDPVIVRPRARADAFDLMLAGKVALIEAIEEDAEGKLHVAVVLEDDPGRDLGILRQPGHRFFYGIDEVEPVRKEVAS